MDKPLFDIAALLRDRGKIVVAPCCGAKMPLSALRYVPVSGKRRLLCAECRQPEAMARRRK